MEHILQAIFLGFLQGLTEFLPISSSAHLALAQYFLGFEEGSSVLVFDVFIHLATLLAVIFYFRKDLFPISRISLALVKYVALATVPTVVAALFLKNLSESFFHQNLYPIGFTLLANALFLTSLRFLGHKEGGREVNRWRALMIGLVQGMAVMPGLSRSGSTITASLWLGLKREEAVRFSFLAAIPAIIGANILVFHEALPTMSWHLAPGMISGFVAAFISGYFAIALMMKLVQKGKIYYFAFYTAPLAIFILIYFLVFKG